MYISSWSVCEYTLVLSVDGCALFVERVALVMSKDGVPKQHRSFIIVNSCHYYRFTNWIHYFTTVYAAVKIRKSYKLVGYCI